jgi:hypothetical protein
VVSLHLAEVFGGPLLWLPVNDGVAVRAEQDQVLVLIKPTARFDLPSGAGSRASDDVTLTPDDRVNVTFDFR